ncbi:MAG: ABC transporter substrate-binding protein [Thermoanaerobaculia bacterium]|nr:ABC transporter substrate-binding protein [Thermoanaerobaculia bacterium]
MTVIAFPEQGNSFLSVQLSQGHLQVSDMARYQGIDLELLDRVARELGVTLEFTVPERFNMNDLFVSLEAGEADIAAGALMITEQRRKLVDFSREYYSFSPVVIVAHDSPIHEYADLLGKTAATTRGSSLEEHLRRAGFDQLLLTDFTVATISSIEKAEADFGLEDEQISDVLVKEHPGVRIAFSFPAEDQYEMAVPKGSDLREWVDRVLLDMDKSGELEALIDRHMESDTE